MNLLEFKKKFAFLGKAIEEMYYDNASISIPFDGIKYLKDIEDNIDFTIAENYLTSLTTEQREAFAIGAFEELFPDLCKGEDYKIAESVMLDFYHGEHDLFFAAIDTLHNHSVHK